MSWADELQARLDEWGRAAFALELESDFSRARLFDSRWAQIDFDVLQQFSIGDLKILGNILPVRNIEFRKSLAGRDRQLLDAFHAAGQQLVLSRREQFMEQAVSTLRKPFRDEMVKIRKMAPAIFKEIASRCDCKIRKDEPSVWMLCRLERWGEIFMPFEFSEEMEFSYYISIEDNDYRRVLEKDSYLGRLGFSAKSACRLTSADTFAEKMAKVAEIIEWQMSDYIRVIERLDWPRIAPFS